MASDSEIKEELLSSVASLYDNPKFSDLSVVTTKRTFHAHKAIVCSRSAYFEREQETLESGASKLNLEADDPEAAGRVLEFLYTLDYTTQNQSGEPNSSNGSTKAVNGNGIHANEEPPTPVKENEEEPATAAKGEELAAGDSLDDFIPRTKKNKKKKRAKSTAQAPDPELLETAQAAQGENPLNGGAREFVPGHTSNEDQAPEKPAVKYIPSNAITAHSRVYALSTKYEIASLKAIALERFERKADALWSTGDFTQAAKEVYSASRGGQDRSLKDIVTRIVVQNLTAIDGEVLKEIMLSGEIGLDLLMHIKKQGGVLKSDTEDTWED